jgi:signal peptidase I
MSIMSQSVIGIREPGALDLVQSLLRQGVSVHIRVSGNSMQPLLRGGDIVEVAPLSDLRPPKLGDILFVRSRHNTPLIHRLIWRRNQEGISHLLTKGDACASFDGFIPENNRIGRIERIVSCRVKKIIDLQTPLMRLQACLIVSAALSHHALHRLRKRKNSIAIRKDSSV